MSRPGPLMFLVSALVAVALTACTANTPNRGAARTPLPASPSPKSPAQICAEVVGYWAEQELRGNSGYGDYQSRGLSDSQNNLLLDIVAGAKAERKKHGARAAAEFAERETAEGCAALYENGGPTSPSHGWPA